MRRREFVTFVCGVAVVWPLVALAQQSALPVVGLLGTGSQGSDAFRVAAVRQGLAEAGYVEGRNVTFVYRGAEDHYDRLPALAIELVRRDVAVIVAMGGNTSAAAAKSATSTIPIVFAIGGE
jgi:putative tryptophan/tyrosine transport system substrate-binding protein